MARAIKSWYSQVLGWKWHATRKEGGRWFGYVESHNSEWGFWTDGQLAEAKAVEISPGSVPG